MPEPNLVDAGKALVKPIDNIDFKVKQDAINELKGASRPAAPTESVRATSPSRKDRINPSGRFGNRPGEQRIDVKDMTKPLGSYKKGTSSVPKTGNYKLHKDEAVIPAEKAKNNMDAVKDIMGGAAEEKPVKEVSHIKIRKGHGGKGRIVEHHHTRPEHHPMEEHVMANQDEMMDHVMQHMGEPNPGEAEANSGQSGIEG